MKRPFAFALFLVLLGTSATVRVDRASAFSPPAASPALLAAHGALRSASPANLSDWAATAPQVAALAAGDHDALLFWLDGHGRGALHAQGATDAQIGVPLYAIDYAIQPAPWPASVPPLPPAPAPPKPTPPPAQHHHSFWSMVAAAALPSIVAPVAHSSSSSTSTSPDGSTTTTQSSSTDVSVGVNTGALLSSLLDAADAHGSSQSPSNDWRQLPFGAMTFASADAPSQIAITHGIASVRSDGTEGFACLSFVNRAAQPATEVDVDIEIIDGLGFVRRVVPLRRVGSFAPGQPVDGPTSVHDVHSAQPNCVIDGENAIADPSDPFAGAFAVGYAVRRVTFADGSVWLEPGANAWPPVTS
jgi:hypothetical protein